MSRRKKIQWSPHDHSMKGFMQLMSHKLPVLAKVTEGYYGLYVFSSEEQYWICKVMKQERVLLSDTTGHHVSIPTSYKDHKFQIMTNGRWSPYIYPLQIVVGKWRISNDDDMKIRVNNDAVINFQAGQDAILQAALGVLTLFDIYDERYFLGHSLDEGEPHPDPVIIPAYMTLRLTEASGLTNSTEEEFNDFKDKIREYVQQFDYPPEIVQGNKEVMLFDGDMGKGDYDYIHPKCSAEIYGTVSEATRPTAKNKDTRSNNGENLGRFEINKKKFDWPMEVEEKKEDPSLGPKLPTPPLPKRNKSHKVGNGLDSFTTPIHNHIVLPIPKQEATLQSQTACDPNRLSPNSSPTHSVPTIPKQRKVPSSPSHMNPISISFGAGRGHSSMVPTPPKPRVAKPRRDVPPDASSNAYTNVSLQTNKPVIQIQPVAPTLQSVTPCSPTNVSKAPQNFSLPPVSFSSIPPDKDPPIPEVIPTIAVNKENGNQDSKSLYDPLKDLPKDRTKLSITELASALHTLKLGQYSETFINQDVDGKLLPELDEEILLEEFEFKRLEAKKLMMWIRGKWEINK